MIISLVGDKVTKIKSQIMFIFYVVYVKHKLLCVCFFYEKIEMGFILTV